MNATQVHVSMVALAIMASIGMTAFVLVDGMAPIVVTTLMNVIQILVRIMEFVLMMSIIIHASV